jgi:hypothetical protein
MEFYSATKNEILSFASKWIELKNILTARLRRPKIVCSPSYAGFRSKANTAMLLELGHMTRGDDIQEVWGFVGNPKHESVSCPHCRGTNTETLK